MPDMTPTPTPLEALAEAIDRVADLGGERDEWYTDADGMAENVIEWVAAAGLRLVPANAPDPASEAREPLRKALRTVGIDRHVHLLAHGWHPEVPFDECDQNTCTDIRKLLEADA